MMMIFCCIAYYAALLPRRGPHIASHSVRQSVCLSVCLSVCPAVPLSIVTERHVASPSELCGLDKGIQIDVIYTDFEKAFESHINALSVNLRHII